MRISDWSSDVCSSDLVGYIASQRISAGTPIKSRALRDPDSIQRGQAVRTEARGTGFVATGEGQALQSGAPGPQIQVRSKSEARRVGKGVTVRVVLGGHRIIVKIKQTQYY